MLIASLKYAISDWQELHFMTAQQLYSGRYSNLFKYTHFMFLTCSFKYLGAQK